MQNKPLMTPSQLISKKTIPDQLIIHHAICLPHSLRPFLSSLVDSSLWKKSPLLPDLSKGCRSYKWSILPITTPPPPRAIHPFLIVIILLNSVSPLYLIPYLVFIWQFNGVVTQLKLRPHLEISIIPTQVMVPHSAFKDPLVSSVLQLVLCTSCLLKSYFNSFQQQENLFQQRFFLWPSCETSSVLPRSPKPGIGPRN